MRKRAKRREGGSGRSKRGHIGREGSKRKEKKESRRIECYGNEIDVGNKLKEKGTENDFVFALFDDYGV